MTAWQRRKLELMAPGVIPRAMISRIKALFQAIDPQAGSAKTHSHDEKALAAAALMVEAARLDEKFDEAERTAIATVVKRHFGLDDAEAAELIEAASEAQAESSQLLSFTRAVKDAYPPEERVEIIEMLWEVAYADGELHPYEANLLRRIGGLIYVSDRERGEARKRVLARLGL